MVTGKVIRAKITILGDATVGKTSILRAYDKKEYSEEYTLTTYDTYSREIILDEQRFNAEFYDTAGQEVYDRLRPLGYPMTTCYIVCFAINCDDSFENVKEKWFPEVKYFSPKAKFILAGTKSDLRVDDVLSKLIKTEEGQELANEIKAHCYIECSSKLHIGIEDLIETAILASVDKTVPCKCDIL